MIAYQSASVTVHHGDCLDVLPSLPAESVHAVICDPPYELGFMAQSWDRAGIAFDVRVWRECLRVLTPGGHLLAFGGTRTFHRLACAIEDAGAELRDTITWLYGSGFPKSHDVSKAIDAAAEAEREVIGRNECGASSIYGRTLGTTRPEVTAPATEAARQWQGWGTALKPASEPIIVARKPIRGTVAAAVTAHGTGALNIDGCRVAANDGPRVQGAQSATGATGFGGVREGGKIYEAGRWPANVLLVHNADCGETCTPGCPVAELDAQSEVTTSSARTRHNATSIGGTAAYSGGAAIETSGHADAGTAARFLPTFRYDPDADTRRGEKIRTTNGSRNAIYGDLSANAGQAWESHPDGRWPTNVLLVHNADCGEACSAGCPVAELDAQSGTLSSGANPVRRNADKFRDAYGTFTGQHECTPARGADTGTASRFLPTFRYEPKAPPAERPRARGQAHPTVKPLALMRWLVRLVTPPGGQVLDPFAGSGATLHAARAEGAYATGIECEADYVALIRARLDHDGDADSQQTMLDLPGITG